MRGYINIAGPPAFAGNHSPMPQSYNNRILDARVYEVAR